MPVSEISKGVFIVAPRDLPKYKDTAAGEYTSVFTKQRADQWEMAQKEALREASMKGEEYKAAVAIYKQRLARQERELADLDKLDIAVRNKEIDSADAARRLGFQVALQNTKEQNDRDAELAAVGVTTKGTKTTGPATGGGGGGRKAPRPEAIGDVNETELGLAKAEAPASDAATYVGAVKTRIDDGRITIGTPQESDAVKYRAVNEAVDDRTAAILNSDPTQDYVSARKQATAEVGADLEDSNNSDFYDAFKRVEGKLDLEAEPAGGTAPTTVTRTSERELQFYDKFPGLQGARTTTAPVAIPGMTREAVLAEIEKKRQAIAGQQIAAPKFDSMDSITRAREIMQGRFGGFSGAPETLPFEQRNAAAQLLSDQAYGLGQIGAYRDFLAKQKAEAATAARLRESLAEGPAVTSVEALRGAPSAQADLTRAAATDLLKSGRPSLFDGLVPPKGPQIPEIAALNIPRKPALTEPPAVTSVPSSDVAPVTPPPPAPPIPEAGPVAPADIRPEAAALMTPAEIAEFKARLQAAADAAQMRRDLAAADMGGTAINPAFRAPLAPPPAAPRGVAPPQFTPTPAVAQPVGDIGIQRPPPPTLGTKEAAALDLSSPAMAPSTSGAAPRGPADVSAAVRPAGPLGGKLPSQVKGETERFAKSTEMAEDVRKATKAGIQPEAYGIKKGGPPSTVGYFQNRAESALELKDKRSKLDRISASGPGKVAKDIYMANAAKKIPFEVTWQEIQLAFAGNEKGREAAHEVALALDLINREENAAPKQAPQ